MIFVASIIPATACVFCAGIVAATGGDSWGWFLVAAIFLTPSITQSKD